MWESKRTKEAAAAAALATAAARLEAAVDAAGGRVGGMLERARKLAPAPVDGDGINTLELIDREIEAVERYIEELEAADREITAAVDAVVDVAGADQGDVDDARWHLMGEGHRGNYDLPARAVVAREALRQLGICRGTEIAHNQNEAERSAKMAEHARELVDHTALETALTLERERQRRV